MPSVLVSKGKGRTDVTGALDVDGTIFAAIVDLPLKKGLVSDRFVRKVSHYHLFWVGFGTGRGNGDMEAFS